MKVTQIKEDEVVEDLYKSSYGRFFCLYHDNFRPSNASLIDLLDKSGINVQHISFMPAACYERINKTIQICMKL